MTHTGDLHWSTCSLGHRHRGDRTTVHALIVDVTGHVLLVHTDDGLTPAWTLPAAALPVSERTSTTAARCAATALDLTAHDVKVLAKSYEEPCERNGIRMHVVVVPAIKPDTLADVDETTHRWIRDSDLEGMALDPFLRDFFARGLRTVTG